MVILCINVSHACFGPRVAIRDNKKCNHRSLHQSVSFRYIIVICNDLLKNCMLYIILKFVGLKFKEFYVITFS
jgi:hypothetical protein